MKLKRITALILFVFMTAGMLAGCQAASGDAALPDSFNKVDDANYVWGLGDAVAAIREATPHRVIVADVHTASPDVTGATMAELGCALSYHCI